MGNMQSIPKRIEGISTRIDASPINFNEIAKEDVLKALNTMNPHKATGHGKLPPKLLKLVADEIALSLTHMLNKVIKVINTSEWYKENFSEGYLTKYQTMIISKQEITSCDY